MTLDKLKSKLLEDKNFRKEYGRYDLTFEISELVLDMRLSAGLTQKQLAKRAKTKQSAISRIENGSSLPSLSFLQRLAHASGGEIFVQFFPLLKRNLCNINKRSVNPSRTLNK